MSTILDQLEPSKINVRQIMSNDESVCKYFKPADVLPNLYTHAWLFYSIDDDENAIEGLEELDARLKCIFIDDYSLNYFKPDLLAYDKIFNQLNPQYKLNEFPNSNEHHTWILQFNLPKKMMPRQVFRLFTSMCDWIGNIHGRNALDTYLYESNGKQYILLSEVDGDAFYGSGIIKRGQKQLQPGAVDLINKLCKIVSKSKHIGRTDIPYAKAFSEIYKHYAVTRHSIQTNVFSSIQAIEMMKTMSNSISNQLIPQFNSNKGPVQAFKKLKDAFDFRSTFGK